jgi:hypothetical protein
MTTRRACENCIQVVVVVVVVVVVMMRNYWLAVFLSAYYYKNYLCECIKCILSVLTEIISESPPV